MDDLVQVAAVGLVKAANRFDTRRGASFPAFAEPTMEGEIRHHLRDRSGTVRIPRELQRLGKRLRSRQSELAATTWPCAHSERAGRCRGRRHQAGRARARRRARAGPGQPAAAEDGAAAVPVEPSPTPTATTACLLTERMHVLDERERQIVYLRFHADMTERQIAARSGSPRRTSPGCSPRRSRSCAPSSPRRKPPQSG